ncbi:thiamine pyrophosphate-binding protein [Lutibaculum baratangense]|uniref:thiamine pyrophosphate-binding protein n=1 Tax=Lutibaculum baratangense TaxID=1358440 RepID=UPI0005909EB0|nr:thiamine pyrophosphate-binding protein [Lutibaculum baratangense]
MRPGGRILVEALEAQGVDHLYCVPGESYLAVLDALVDSPIEVTVCRQEGGAAMMADAYGKMTGRPGICFVTRGPGATNASAGVHIAAQDSTPMILFIGQVERGMLGREAFQEVDYEQFFGGMAKWVVEIRDPARIPELVHRAFATAMSGRPGPVVVSLPEDILTELAEAVETPRAVAPAIRPGRDEMFRLAEMIEQAERPFMILGGSRWSEQAVADIARFAESAGLPVGCSFRRQGLFDHLHENYAGDVGIGPNPKLAERVKEADLLILVGGRMSEMPSSSYTLIDIPRPRQTFVHVHPGAEELNRVYAASLAIQADPASFADEATGFDFPPSEARSKRVAEAHAEYLEWSETVPHGPGDVQMVEIVRHLRDVLPPEAIMTNGAGNYATWIHRFYRFRKFDTLIAPTSGSMGYGTPAAVAAARLHPSRQVVAFAGDGCFLMNGQEFATAVKYGLPIVVVVVDNAMYGTIRMHQEREYPTRISATELTNPDFAAMGRAYGGEGYLVERTEEFAPAFEAAVRSGRPSIIHVRLDPEAITPRASLSEIRAAALARQA